MAVPLCVMFVLTHLAIGAPSAGSFGLASSYGTSAWSTYQAAVEAAISYGCAVYVAFDLYRFDMLRVLHLPLPRARLVSGTGWTRSR